MDQKSIYDQLFLDSLKEVERSNFKIDPFLNDESDDRYGITLLIRPNLNIGYRIQHFLNKLKVIDPNQYFYRHSDIHITVMSIISCYSGFCLSEIEIEKYVDVIEKSLLECSSFTVKIKGVTASDSTVMLRGFYKVNTLDKIRDNLRDSFSSSILQQSIDSRYKIATAHITVVRFKKALVQKVQLIELLKRFETYNFGSFEASELELVFNDWYHRKERVKLLKRIRL